MRTAHAGVSASTSGFRQVKGRGRVVAGPATSVPEGPCTARTCARESAAMTSITALSRCSLSLLRAETRVRPSALRSLIGAASAVLCLGSFMTLAQPAGAATVRPAVARLAGEIERLTVKDPHDVWSEATMVVGGQNIIIPRNLLADLPANRLTMQQLLEQAPPGCVAHGETGLAKSDACNTSGTGGIATI